MSVGLGQPLSADLVGVTVGPLTQTVDARWLMAYAAALGEEDPRYFDTTAPAGPRAHPVFAVCYEWPLAVELRERVLGEAVSRRGVHASHRLVIHRPPRAGEQVVTTARIAEVRASRAGTLVVVASETVAADGAPVTTSYHGSVYRGVSTNVPAPARGAQDPSGGEAPTPTRWEARVPVPAQMGHVYTECARIWNPIHTDLAVARAAGLPAPILHGTATLALAVSRVVATDLGGEPQRVATVSARFTGMVIPPCPIIIRGRTGPAGTLAFDVLDAQGRPVLSQGALTSCSR